MSYFIASVLAYLMALNFGVVGLQALALWRRPSRLRWLIVVGLLWAVLINVLAVVQVSADVAWKPLVRHWLYFPLTVEMAWNLLLIQPYFLGWLVAVLVLRIKDRYQMRRQPAPTQATPAQIAEGLSRRRFVYLLACGAAPATAIGMGVHGSLSRNDLRVRRLDVPITGLPPALEGFTIAHLSDPHSGIFCGPRRLRLIRDAANDLNADLMVITGDIINHSFDELPAALEIMQSLRARHGLHLCEGNHDTFPGPGVIGSACRSAGLSWLYDSGATVPLDGGRLVLGGLPWMNHGFEGQPEIVNHLYLARQPGDVRILLAHHPHLFDIADGVDLVLAGHTHGGQIMAGPKVGFGPLFFRYWSGLYRRNATALVVSNGCGDWFPCRIDAPAEIGLLRLTAA